MERARELIKPYLEEEGVIGIYVVGSATRPHRDGLSDYDIEVIVADDVYARTPDEERQTFFFKEGKPKIVDYEFYLVPWSDFERLTQSTLDLFHYPYQYAVVLHDPEGRIAPIIKKLAELPDQVRLDRIRVHFLEFLYGLGRMRKTARRGDAPLNLALLRGDALGTLLSLLSLVKGSWPATRHWSEQELRGLGVPKDLLAHATVLASPDPDPDAVKDLVDAVTSFLDAHGETFHKDMTLLERWLFFTAEGKRAFEMWGRR